MRWSRRRDRQRQRASHPLSFFFSSRRRHTRCLSDWSSDVCSSDLGIDGTKSEVIVGIATVVEMKPAYHLVMEQPGDDLLDVLCLVVMSRIHQHIRLRTRSLGQ